MTTDDSASGASGRGLHPDSGGDGGAVSRRRQQCQCQRGGQRADPGLSIVRSDIRASVAKRQRGGGRGAFDHPPAAGQCECAVRRAG
ncbi:hypothetical protein LP420_35930 [Massilia sp. B-10]|nr:hypothetical protein LP420_35930 [Massilia sp. B-10]